MSNVTPASLAALANNSEDQLAPQVDVAALLAQVAELEKKNVALEASNMSAADRPIEAKIGDWTDKQGKTHVMMNITGPYRPINFSVAKARKIVEAMPQILAALATLPEE